MRDFADAYKIYAGSLIEIRNRMKRIVLRLSETKILFGPKLKLNKVRVLNGLVLWFIFQTKEEQDRIMTEMMPILWKHKKSKTPLKLELPARGDAAALETAAPSVPKKVEPTSHGILSIGDDGGVSRKGESIDQPIADVDGPEKRPRLGPTRPLRNRHNKKG